MAFTTKSLRSGVALAGLMLAAGLVLAGCRAEEQGRPLMYKPGTYLGKPDTQLSEAQKRNLSLRAQRQSGSVGLSGGAMPSRTADVSRPRGSDTLNWDALNNRLRQQGTSEPQK